MHVPEKQPCKVLIDVTRSGYGDRQEDDGVRPICVYLTIIPYLYSDFLFLFIINRESERYIENLYMSVGVMKD